MDDSTARIDELRVRVSGVSAEQGRALGEELARAISEYLHHEGGERNLGAIDLRVSVAAGTAPGDMARQVARKIAGALQC